MKFRFTKMQGLGNDFVVIDATKQPFAISASHIKQLSQRRFGIGFDQLLMIVPASKQGCDFGYRIFNADGSEVEQCGNGARAVARYIHERGLHPGEEYTLELINGQMKVKVVDDKSVSAEFAEPHFKPEQIPCLLDPASDGRYHIKFNDQDVTFGIVNVGNPHAILLVDDVQATRIAEIGQKLSTHPAFPQGVNVSFMQIVDPNHVLLRVFERGVGQTMACGSAACAAVVWGRSQDKLAECVNVKQPGGELEIMWPGAGHPITMTGDAFFVYEGEWIER